MLPLGHICHVLLWTCAHQLHNNHNEVAYGALCSGAQVVALYACMSPAAAPTTVGQMVCVCDAS
jgi:hypothetical protein